MQFDVLFACHIELNSIVDVSGWLETTDFIAD